MKNIVGCNRRAVREHLSPAPQRKRSSSAHGSNTVLQSQPPPSTDWFDSPLDSVTLQYVKLTKSKLHKLAGMTPSSGLFETSKYLVVKKKKKTMVMGTMRFK